jgi:hypothetical protein
MEAAMTVDEAVMHLDKIAELAEGQDKEALLLVAATLRMMASEVKSLRMNLRLLEEWS